MISPNQTYNSFENFRPFIPGQPQTTEEYSAELEKLSKHYNKQIKQFIDHFNREQGKHNDTIDAIKQGSGVAAEMTINNLISAAGGGGGSTGSTGPEIRGKTESLTANVSKNIVFSSPIATTFALTSLRLYNSTNLYITDFTISSITANGFTIVCPETCTLVYLAVEET